MRYSRGGRLNGLGFDTKVTGKFDDETRSVFRRWQAARGGAICRDGPFAPSLVLSELTGVALED